MKLKLSLLFYVTLVIASIHITKANTYYVAKTGNDTCPGTEAEPWLTITHASAVLVAGDTCWVKAGTYNEYVDFWTAGTVSDPIVFKSFDGWSSVIRGSLYLAMPHIVIQGVTVILPDTSVRAYAIRLENTADSCTVDSCHIYLDPPNSLLSVGILWGWSFDDFNYGAIVSNNTIHDFGLGTPGDGLYMHDAHCATVTHNTIYNCNRNNIQAYLRIDSCEIAYNVCYGCMGANILVDGWYSSVHHNICYNGKYGIELINEGLVVNNGHNKVFNNVLFSNKDGLVLMNDNGYDSVYNNIYLANRRNSFNVQGNSWTGLVSDYNCFYGGFINGGSYADLASWQTNAHQDLHGIDIDPLVVDTVVFNFHLQTASPCIDAGDTTASSWTDFDGTSRPQGCGYDIGAYEYILVTANAGEDQTICNGTTATLTATGDGTYQWNGGNTNATITVNPEVNATYTVTATLNDCASIDTVVVYINDIGVTLLGNTITADSAADAYQWLDCDNSYAIIPDETDQNFTPIVSGNYAAEITRGSCTDTSACVQVTIVGIASLQAGEINIYPNPVSDELIIENKGNKEKIDFEILNSTGQVVFKGSLTEKTVVQTTNLVPGIYLIKSQNLHTGQAGGKTFELKKVVKE